MSAFVPTFCPFPGCRTTHPQDPFQYHRDGTYPRALDGRRVQRFRCRRCRRRFSSQTFRLDYCLKKPRVNELVLACLVSKVTHRQTARILRIDRKTVHRRLSLYGPAMRRWHLGLLRLARKRGGLRGSFSLDELETYEHDRRLKPLTVPVLIHRATRFLVHVETADLPARGSLRPTDAARKTAQENRGGRRISGSKQAVESCIAALKVCHAPHQFLQLVVDQKKSYPPIIRRHFGNRISALIRESSKTKRNTLNPMFPMNHMLAMLRDQISRLVRRTWAASKRQSALRDHLWTFLAWRNYVRPMFNHTPQRSSAMELGVAARLHSSADLLRWKWPDRMESSSNGWGQYPLDHHLIVLA